MVEMTAHKGAFTYYVSMILTILGVPTYLLLLSKHDCKVASGLVADVANAQ